MKKKFLGIFVCTLLIAITVLPVAGIMNNKTFGEKKSDDYNESVKPFIDCDPVQSTPFRGCEIIYAGTSNPGMVYKYKNDVWTAISNSLGFAVLDIIYFEDDLYAATTSHRGIDAVGKVWRYGGGNLWYQVDSMDNQTCDLEIWNGDLYAGTAKNWNNGGKLYVYNRTALKFDFVGTMPSDYGPGYHIWHGIRAMYNWSKTGHLHLGDYSYDCFGRFDGSNMIFDAYMIGSCIYDFAEFNNSLYAAAYDGRILWSLTGIGPSWSDQYVYAMGKLNHLWELETFQNHLYIGSLNGTLGYIDTSHNLYIPWRTPNGESGDQQICSMISAGNFLLYFGTGKEAGYVYGNSGIARVYAYDGVNTPVEIFNADGGDTDGIDHAGIQCLYRKIGPLNFCKDDEIADNECVNRGDKITYHLTFENPYPFTLTDVTVVDYLPDEVWFNILSGPASSPPSWNYYSGPPATIEWDWWDIPPGTSWHCWVEVMVDKVCPFNTTICNTAMITSNKTGWITVEECTTSCAEDPNNNLPYAPDITIEFPWEIPVGVAYPVKIKPVDPDGNPMYLWIDWDDGTDTGWIGPYPSDEEVTVNHTWTEKGTYIIKAKAEDIWGAEGPWANLTVNVPRNRATYHSMFLRLFERFPLLEKLLTLFR